MRQAGLLCCIPLLLAGCTDGQKGMVDTLNSAFLGDPDAVVSPQQVQSLPYPSMYLRLNQNPQAVLVLGYVQDGNSQWLSADNGMVVTRQGRLLKTVNVYENLLEVIAVAPDPLLEPKKLTNGTTWTRIVRWTEDKQPRSAKVTSSFVRAKQDETLQIAGKAVPCQVWYEDAVSEAPGRSWRNTFWIDAITGEVRQSHQMLGAGTFPVEMTMLKPAP